MSGPLMAISAQWSGDAELLGSDGFVGDLMLMGVSEFKLRARLGQRNRIEVKALPCIMLILV